MSLGIRLHSAFHGGRQAHAFRGQTVGVSGGRQPFCPLNARRCSTIARTAQRDEAEEAHRGSPGVKGDDVSLTRNAPPSSPPHNMSEQEELATPLAFASSTRLPSLSCNPHDPASCLNVSSVQDPRLDPSVARQVRDYTEQLLGSGMTAERAREVIQQWSDGGGIEMVDLRKLRRHFLRSTLLPALRQRLPHAALDIALTAMSFGSLSLLPAADEQLLHPALRGALVAVNLLLLVAFASGALKTAGRMVRVSNAAVAFSQQAELVLLALQALADGHGNLITAAQGSPVAAALADVEAERVLTAAAAVMRHAKRTAAAAAAAPAPAAAAPRGAAVPGSTAASAAALSSLDAFLVLQQAAAGGGSGGGGGRYGSHGGSGGGGFDAVAELGMTAEEAAAAAAMFARFGDSTRDGRIGEFEFRRLLQEAGAPSLSVAEVSLALLLADPDKKGWLSFRDWATWWANSPPAEPEQVKAAEVEARMGAAVAEAEAAVSDAGGGSRSA